jgi:nitroreductase
MPRHNSSSPARRARHAATLLRLTTLVDQLAPLAAKRPGEAVSPAVRSLAEDILFEARSFRPRGERRGLPPASPDYAGLAAQLGQVLLTLRRFGQGAFATGAPSKQSSPEEVAIVRRKFQQKIDMMVANGVREKLAERAAAAGQTPGSGAAGGGREEIYPRVSNPL